jgi:predicted DNA-binding ribbon-helix-helix protein
VKTRKTKEVEGVKLSKENYDGLKKIAKKSGLKLGQVVDMILECELDIIEYVVWKREKLAKQLKIKPTLGFLYHKTL